MGETLISLLTMPDAASYFFRFLESGIILEDLAEESTYMELWTRPNCDPRSSVPAGDFCRSRFLTNSWPSAGHGICSPGCTATNPDINAFVVSLTYTRHNGSSRERQLTWSINRSIDKIARQGGQPGSPPRQGVPSRASTLSIHLAHAQRRSQSLTLLAYQHCLPPKTFSTT